MHMQTKQSEICMFVLFLCFVTLYFFLYPRPGLAYVRSHHHAQSDALSARSSPSCKSKGNEPYRSAPRRRRLI